MFEASLIWEASGPVNGEPRRFLQQYRSQGAAKCYNTRRPRPERLTEPSRAIKRP